MYGWVGGDEKVPLVCIKMIQLRLEQQGLSGLPMTCLVEGRCRDSLTRAIFRTDRESNTYSVLLEIDEQPSSNLSQEDQQQAGEVLETKQERKGELY